MIKKHLALGLAALAAIVVVGCGQIGFLQKHAVIYPAKGVVSMQGQRTPAEAVAVENGTVIAVGGLAALKQKFPYASTDDIFADKFIVPGFIDPHVHMMLSSLQYALPLTPPWPMATPQGMVEGLDTRETFLARLKEIETDPANGAKSDKPLVVYGYHDLVHGPLDRHDLDAITTARPLIVWHFSSHDFYLNTAALAWAKVDASLHEKFEGVPLAADGLPTGRVFEDALPYFVKTAGPILLDPLRVRRGILGFSTLLRQGGVTTVADLGYGIFGLPLEDLNIRLNWRSAQKSGYRLYLVPEHRAFDKAFGEQRVQRVLDMVSGKQSTPAPVLPQVKFFADAAYYSQTMRLSPPGYLAGQSQGTQGLWVLPPDEIAATIQPYWDAGLGVRIHSNGDAAQTATLKALETLRVFDKERRFVIEHGALFSPLHVQQAKTFGAAVSAASHYVFYLGEAYQPLLGAERGNQILPLASLSAAGVPVTLHSDAPLAPPLPLRAASVHLTRATKEGNTLTPDEALSRYEALEAITIDAAFALGLEHEIGSIAPGKRADFTILEQNPLETPGANWPDIAVWGVVLAGKKRPLPKGDN